ncbi:MAG: hypothetical protein AVDCRST_MAG30-2561 [uncultured Solirubrobacteraceae bacterium]|uniref:Uncharacterized protein n=1 Tax=uncultured Solirubrobacteraceae bacterium TaxID=1162706 RepID=A0A6J4T3N4_9ACTN|nr:MAG: hypothetical protein AVDCRST_MAG30-2561 [uncultured Solirubrobacteraceae bacterium]
MPAEGEGEVELGQQVLEHVAHPGLAESGSRTRRRTGRPPPGDPPPAARGASSGRRGRPRFSRWVSSVPAPPNT